MLRNGKRKKEILDFELREKTMLLEKLNSTNTAFNNLMGASALFNKKDSSKIPDKVRELMDSSPNHPEVSEIDGSDEIIGVRFEAENYPPGFDDDEE